MFRDNKCYNFNFVVESFTIQASTSVLVLHNCCSTNLQFYGKFAGERPILLLFLLLRLQMGENKKPRNHYDFWVTLALLPGLEPGTL